MVTRHAGQLTTILNIGNTGVQPFHLPSPDEGTKYRLLHTDSMAQAHELLRQEDIGLVIISADFFMDNPAREIEKIQHSTVQIEILIMADLRAENKLPDSLFTEGVDFIDSKAGSQLITSRIGLALQHLNTRLELLMVREHVAMTFGLDNIVGLSEPIRKIRDTISRVAATDITILITGPAGCGRKLMARTIHHHSNRRKAPFVTVDCSTLGPDILERELFGQSDGSAGFDESRRSSLQQADGATLFIHEIDRMSERTQHNLAQFLATYQLPSQSEPDGPRVDIRFLITSSVNLEKAAEAGGFSERLLSLLNLLSLTIPPLRDRIDDIEPLTEYFLRRLVIRPDRKVPSISRSALDRLFGYSWPGDVGELENCLQRAASLCQGDMIDAEDIRFVNGGNGVENSTAGRISSERTGLLADRQQDIICRALDENNWNFTQTAAELGIGRTTLWRKVRKYNLKQQKVNE